jgi:hypothetical protein
MKHLKVAHKKQRQISTIGKLLEMQKITELNFINRILIVLIKKFLLHMIKSFNNNKKLEKCSLRQVIIYDI